MAHQSPMISIPRKATEEVDWTTPIRNLIAQSYGESPDNYATECASLQRCRQDAVRGAGSDNTARDLLYKYFGQLELLELRFSEIRVNFPWRDAFTNKLTIQSSIAYEKASVLFQIASTHSAIAAAQSRSDPEGVKRAFHYFKTCAGMLTYINENFLHAPSTDLSREVVKFLVGIILAQATEVFFEKVADEKKGHALVAKIGAQTAYLYTTLSEEVKEFMGKGIFDRNWVTLIQIKSKYFSSLAQYYRGLADNTAGKYGDALVRFTLAEGLAKDASRSASSFGSMFVPNVSPTLPADAGPSIQERTKAHLSLMSDRKAEAQRDNDLIYNAILPNPESLAVIEKTAVAQPIPIQEVYSTPEVQKTIGQDLFVRLIPLSVHESASVYSEEKAKLVRTEVENSESADVQVRSALDSLGVKEGLSRFRAMAEGEVGADAEIPVNVKRWQEDISYIEGREAVDGVISQLNRLKDTVRNDLERIGDSLEAESRECEAMRVKYDHLWAQDPSATHSKTLRQDLKSHMSSLEAAQASDNQVYTLWDQIRGEIRLLLSPQIEDVFRASTQNGVSQDHLLDLDIGKEANEDQERGKIAQLVADIDNKLGTLNKITRERKEIIKELKEKIQTDDVSHLLLLNRRNTGVEPSLFAAELEKFQPFQQRLADTVQRQETVIAEVGKQWKQLKDHAGRGAGARKWDERETRKKETISRFSRVRDIYMEIRDGLTKGLQFYNDLTEITNSLKSNAKSFISSRTSERESLIAKLEMEKRLSAPTSPPAVSRPPPQVPPPPSDLSSRMSGLSMRDIPSAPSAPPTHWQSPQSYGQNNSYSSIPSQYASSPPPRPPPPPSQPSYNSSYYQQPQSSFPHPPPAPVQTDPYASLDMLGSNKQYGASYSPAPSAPPPMHSQQQQQPGQHYGLPPPPPPVNYQYGAAPQQQPQQGYRPPPPPGGYGGYR